MAKPLVSPGDESKPFITRWNALVRVLLVESSVKLIARSAMDYAGYEDGTSCRPSNERIVRETGYTEKTVRFAWAVMRGLGMAERVVRGVAHLRIADEYELCIPGQWKGLPILGPYRNRFTCLHCERPVTPQGNCSVNSEPDDPPGGDRVRFDLSRMCFCPPPRKTKGRSEPACFEAWNEQRVAAGERPWGRLGDDRWKLFRQSRGDDW